MSSEHLSKSSQTSISGSTWSEVGNNPLQGTGYVGTGVHEGVSVAMSADGTTLLMTGEHDDNNGTYSNGFGAMWVFAEMNAPTMSPTITGGTRAPTTSAPTAPTTTAAPSTFGTSRSQYIYQKLATYNTAWPEYLQHQRFSGETSDAFAFFKANPFLFHLDYDLDPRLALFGTNFTRIWISGDQHLDNFGTVCVYLDIYYSTSLKY